MTISISTALKDHLALETSTIAYCIKITREDGQIFGYTSHDQDITYNTVLYKSKGGFSPSTVESKADASVPNLEIIGVLSSDSISETDLKQGLFDNAAFEAFILNYSDLTQGSMVLRKGWFGEVTLRQGQFTTELRGLASKLQTKVGELYTPACSVRRLGDSRCKVNTTPFRFSLTVTGVVSDREFSHTINVQAADYFKYGILKWTNGNNDDLEMEIKEYTVSGGTGTFFLQLPMPKAVQVGDTFQATRGCDRTFATCQSVFNNAVNFRGFPHIPGIDKMMSTP